MANIYVRSRRKWKARPPRRRSLHRLNRNSTFFVHYSAFEGRRYNTFAKQAESMRSMQRFHMDGQGWDDLGYSFVIFQATKRFPWPRIFTGRGWDTVPSAQAGHNTGNVGVCVVMGPGEKVHKRTVWALRYLYRRFPGRFVKGHRDVSATSCPGPLYAVLPKIRSAKKRR